jgi:hypothetical protein
VEAYTTFELWPVRIPQLLAIGVYCFMLLIFFHPEVKTLQGKLSTAELQSAVAAPIQTRPSTPDKRRYRKLASMSGSATYQELGESPTIHYDCA